MALRKFERFPDQFVGGVENPFAVAIFRTHPPWGNIAPVRLRPLVLQRTEDVQSGNNQSDKGRESAADNHQYARYLQKSGTFCFHHAFLLINR